MSREQITTLDFKLSNGHIEFDARMRFRRQTGSAHFTIDVIARSQGGDSIRNYFDYNQILNHIPMNNRQSLLRSPTKLLEEIKKRVKFVVDGDNTLLVLQENTFGEEVDPVHCIKRQRTKDWEIQRIGSGKYHVQPMFSGADPGSPAHRRKQAKEGRMSWHSGNAGSDADANPNDTFKTTVRPGDRSAFSAQNVDLSTIRDSTLQSLLAPPLLTSTLSSPSSEMDVWYDADSEEEEPMPDDHLAALATSRWEDNINFGDSPIDSPAADAPVLPVVHRKHSDASNRSQLWGEFLDTKSLAKRAKKRAEKKAARAARTAIIEDADAGFRGMGGKTTLEQAPEGEVRPPKCAVNARLASGAWLSNIMWSPNPAQSLSYEGLELNLNDGNIHLEDVPSSDEVPDATDTEPEDPQDESNEPNGGKSTIFNLSEITESLPVNPRLFCGQPELNDQQLFHFHRPRATLWGKSALLSNHMFTPVFYSANSIEQLQDEFSLGGGSGARMLLQKRSDFSAKDGRLLMLEYGLEERPRVLTNVGSPSVLLNFVRHNENGSHPRLVSNMAEDNRRNYDFPLGRTIQLDKKALPLIGNIKNGDSQCVMVNSLAKAPAFEQDAQHTDFLVVISTDTISGAVTAKVREMPNLMVVGQQEFISTVEKPHSKKLNAFVHKHMKFHVLNLFRQCPKKPATIKTHQVQTMLWRQPYLQIRTILNQLSKYKRKGEHGRMWVLREDEDAQAVENISSKEVCLYEACLSSQMHLRTIGLPRLAESPSLGKIQKETRSTVEQINMLKERAKEPDGRELKTKLRRLKAREKLLTVIETQLKLTAWEWTRQYMDYHVLVLGATLLEIDSPTLQPCDKAIGFAFALPHDDKADRPTAVPKVALAGHKDRDLRKFTVTQLKRLCRELGYNGPRLARWKMVGYVRRHSKDEKLTRPLRETHHFRRARYKNTCQRRFDAQRKMMGSKTIVEDSSDPEDSDDILGDMWDDDKSSDDAELKDGTDILKSIAADKPDEPGERPAATASSSSPAKAVAVVTPLVQKSNVNIASQLPAGFLAVASGGNAIKPAPLSLFGMDSANGSKFPSEDSSRVNSLNVSAFPTPNASRPGSPTRTGKSGRTKMCKYKGSYWVMKETRIDRNNKVIIKYIRNKKDVSTEIKRLHAQKQGRKKSLQRRFKQQTRMHTKKIMKRQTLSQQRKELESLKKTLTARQNYIELLSTGAITPKTPGSKNIRCSACQQEGHMRTNKMCPFYRHDNVALADVDAGKIVIPKIKIKKQERVTINLAELKFKSKEALKSKKKWKRKQSKTQVVDLYRPYQKRIRRVRNPEVELRKMLVRALVQCSSEPNCWSKFLHEPVRPEHFTNSLGYGEYMAKIKNPISISEIRKNIESDKTPSRNKLMKDLTLLVQNAIVFHGVPSLNPKGISAIATNLKQAVWTTLYVKEGNRFDDLEACVSSLWEDVDEEVLLEGLFFALPICSEPGVEHTRSATL